MEMDVDDCLKTKGLKSGAELGSKFSIGLESYIINTLEQDARLSSVEFDVSNFKEGVFQGICTFKIDDCAFAAVSRADNLSDLTNELLNKIKVQLPNKYEFTQLAPKFHQIYLQAK